MRDGAMGGDRPLKKRMAAMPTLVQRAPLFPPEKKSQNFRRAGFSFPRQKNSAKAQKQKLKKAQALCFVPAALKARKRSPPGFPRRRNLFGGGPSPPLLVFGRNGFWVLPRPEKLTPRRIADVFFPAFLSPPWAVTSNRAQPPLKNKEVFPQVFFKRPLSSQSPTRPAR